MRTLATFLLSLILLGAEAQGGWKLTRDQGGIRVFQSDGKGIRNIRVECTLSGTLDAFERTLRNVAAFPDWVYGNKRAELLKSGGPDDYYYYSETALPWPLQNRDAAVHARFERDPKGQWLRLYEKSESGLVPPRDGKVRVAQSAISWIVTPAAGGQLHIVYTFQADPGGSIPAWAANAFADKGPYESFKKLAVLLKSR
ncbi:MAG: hypothetical protein EOO12_05835 [Chitinophagaceae bacterium]|nr:MAG: hypothetical protein EOO12_05835 [Chitinophagaceae bacterium]